MDISTPRFDRGSTARRARKVKFGVTEGWRVETATFKNEAIVLFGKKGAVTPIEGFPGKLERVDGYEPLDFRVLTLGDRVIWSDNPDAEARRLVRRHPVAPGC